METGETNSRTEGPADTTENSSPDVPPPLAKEHLSGQWHITHSTRPIWRGKRNVRLHIEDSGSKATYSYQDMNGTKLHKTVVASSKWVALGKGKAGDIPNGMRETEWGIEDSSGEVRGDWRPTWLLLSVEDAPEGIEILSSRTYKYELVMPAVTKFLHSTNQAEKLGISGAFEVKMDDGRKAFDAQELEEAMRAANRSAPETGIWRAEDEDSE